MKKNDEFIGTSVDYTNEGFGVVKEDGIPYFVKGLMKGEEALCKVVHVKKSYGFARVSKLLKQSSFRREMPCEYAKQCGGCQLQHMEYVEQLRFKEQKVKSALARIGKYEGDVYPILKGEEWTYRNKAQIPVKVVGGRLQMGFYRINSNDIVDMDTCMIQEDMINEVFKLVREELESHIDIARHIRHVLIKYATHTKTIMVVWITSKRRIHGLKEISTSLTNKNKSIVSIIQNVNMRSDNVILGEEEYLLYGKETIEDTLSGHTFAIASKSFYQVNHTQTEVLYEMILKFADFKKNEHVLDLYCGLGTITLMIAPHVASISGVEVVREAVESAKQNAENNNIKNVVFTCEDAGTYARRIQDQTETIDTIVVDPPRKGLDAQTKESIVAINPKKLVYVSCDPGTLARDIKELVEHGFKVEGVQPVDLFPQTFHVETVVLMSKE